MNVQRRIAEYVINTGIRQSFIVGKTGLSPNRVSAILNCKSKMSADEYELFCKALNKLPGEFIRAEEES